MSVASDPKSSSNGKKKENGVESKSLVNEFEAAYSDLLSSFNSEEVFFQVRFTNNLREQSQDLFNPGFSSGDSVSSRRFRPNL